MQILPSKSQIIPMAVAVVGVLVVLKMFPTFKAKVLG